MALQTDTVSLTLATSLSQQSDDKQIDTTKLASSEETRVVKDKRVEKRDGLQDYPLTQENLTTTNPITIGDAMSQNWVYQFQDQDLLQNKGVMYVRKPSSDAWSQEAYIPNLKVVEQPVASSSYTALYQDTLEALGYRVTVTSDDLAVRYSVYRLSDNNFVVRDAVLRARTTDPLLGGFFGQPKIVAMTNSFAVLVADDQLWGYVLTPSTAALSAAVSLESSYGSANPNYDALFLAGSAAGDRLIVMYGQSGSPLTLKAYTTALAVDATVGTATAATSAGGFDVQNVYLYNAPQISVNRIFGFNSRYVTTYAVEAAGFYNFVIDITASGWTTVRAHTLVGSVTPRTRGNGGISNVMGITALIDAQDPTKVNAWYSFRDFSTVDDYRTYVMTQGTTGVPTTAFALWSYGMSVIAEPYNDTERQTTYVPVAFFQGTSSIIGVSDFHRSRVLRRQYLVARFGEGKIKKTISNGGGLPTSPVGRTWSTGSSFSFAYLAIQRYISIDNNQADVGADMATVSLASNPVTLFQSNKNLYVGGAQTWSYDGSDVGEHGFSIKPAAPYVSIGTPLAFTITQAGTAGAPEITVFTFGNADLFARASTTYFTINSPTSSFYVWYDINGNTDPAPGGTGVRVVLASDDTYIDVVRKTRAAWINTPGVSGFNLVTDTTARTVTFTNTGVGVVTTPTAVSNADDGQGQVLPVGTYQFIAVYSYIDSMGKKFRSRPSPVSTAVVTGTSKKTFSAVFVVPDITNREYKLNEVELYATEANGSVFYWLSNGGVYSRVPWTGAAPRLRFQNKTIPVGYTLFSVPYASNENLYTNGDVLENDYTTGWDKVTTYKGRVVVGFPQSQTLVYSKTNAIDEGLAFSEFLQIVADQDDDDVQALGELDDKLIIFKSRQKYVVAGDPANDAGTGSSLSLPTLISSDVGSTEQQSLVKSSLGLFYRSGKGVYLLGRDLSDKYVGSAIQDTNGLTVSKAILSPSANEIVYFFSDSQRAYAFNYELGIWSIWRNHQCEFAAAGSSILIVRSNGRVLRQVPGQRKDVENGVSTAVTYLIEMPWLKLKGQQDFQRIYDFMILGAYKSPHSLLVEIWWDYDMRDAVKQTITISSADIISGVGYADQTYQAKFSPMIQKCEAMKIRISDVPVSVDDAESCTLNAIDFNVGIKKGQNKIKSEKKA